MFSTEEIRKAKDNRGFEKRGGKQIMGVSKIKHKGEKAVLKYTLEDGTEVMEDEEGQAVQSWPEVPKSLKAKRAKTK